MDQIVPTKLSDSKSRQPGSLKQLLLQPPLSGSDLIATVPALQVNNLVHQLRLLHQLLKACDQQIKDIIDAMQNSPSEDDDASATDAQYSDVEILQSVPGLGINTMAVLFSEAEPALKQRNYSALRTLSGVAPVTKRSGRKLVVCQRRAVNQLLQNALYHWAANACLHDAHCKQKYQALRQRGKSHGQALRTVGDRLLNVVCAMLRSNSLYQVPHSLQEAAWSQSIGSDILTDFRLDKSYEVHCQYPGEIHWCICCSLPNQCQSSPYYRWVDLRDYHFEACSAFTQVVACTFAESPHAILLSVVLQSMSLPP